MQAPSIVKSIIKSRIKSIGYRTYINESKKLISAVPNLISCNAMNNISAMSPHIDYEHYEFNLRNVSYEDVKSTWTRINQCDIDTQSFVSKGVRNSILSIMNSFNDGQFIIPSNVYPVYEQLAQEAKVEYRMTDPTLTQYGQRLNLDHMIELSATKNSFIILTDPLPIGATRLTKENINKLVVELNRRDDLFIIIDAVYAPKFFQNISLF